jgi:hypothetical protein
MLGVRWSIEPIHVAPDGLLRVSVRTARGTGKAAMGWVEVTPEAAQERHIMARCILDARAAAMRFRNRATP